MGRGNVPCWGTAMVMQEKRVGVGLDGQYEEGSGKKNTGHTNTNAHERAGVCSTRTDHRRKHKKQKREAHARGRPRRRPVPAQQQTTSCRLATVNDTGSRASIKETQAQSALLAVGCDTTGNNKLPYGLPPEPNVHLTVKNCGCDDDPGRLRATESPTDTRYLTPFRGRAMSMALCSDTRRGEGGEERTGYRRYQRQGKRMAQGPGLGP